MRGYYSKSRKVALGGIVTLLSTVSLYISSVLPTNRIFFFALSTFFLAIIIIEDSVKSAIVVFLSSSILSFIIIPNKMTVIPYMVFFGYYAIFKSIIERINKIFIELLIKLLLFNLSTYIVYSVISKAILGEIIIKLPVWVLFLLMQLAFIIYDYSFSLGIYFYRNKIRSKIK